MADPVLNAVDCPCCDARARVTAASSGALTIFCGSCKFQGFAKSPRAVDGLKKKMGAGSPPVPPKAPAGDPPKKPAGSSWLEQL